MKKLLHVGCGHSDLKRTTPGFNNGDWSEIRLDIDEGVKPDIIGSMTHMDNVESESIDAVFSSHNIEHLLAHEIPLALAEFIRVLKSDGICVILCPDLQSVCELVANDKLLETAYVSPAGPISPFDMLYGHRASIAEGKIYMAHRSGFTQKVLAGTLKASGFQSVISIRRPGVFDLCAVASKNKRKEDEMRSLAQEHFRTV